jgi:hypothetical protein
MCLYVTDRVLCAFRTGPGKRPCERVRLARARRSRVPRIVDTEGRHLSCHNAPVHYPTAWKGERGRAGSRLDTASNRRGLCAPACPPADRSGPTSGSIHASRPADGRLLTTGESNHPWGWAQPGRDSPGPLTSPLGRPFLSRGRISTRRGVRAPVVSDGVSDSLSSVKLGTKGRGTGGSARGDDGPGTMPVHRTWERPLGTRVQ